MRQEGRRETRSCGCLWRALPHFELELKVCCCCCSMRWLATQHAPLYPLLPLPHYPTTPSLSQLFVPFSLLRLCLCKKAKELLCFFARSLCACLSPLADLTHTHTHKSLTSCRHSGAPPEHRGECGGGHTWLSLWVKFICVQSSRSKLFSELHFNLTQLFIYLLPLLNAEIMRTLLCLPPSLFPFSPSASMSLLSVYEIWTTCRISDIWVQQLSTMHSVKIVN